MFSIFKKSIPIFSSDYFPIVTDMHSHILPGIDDGSPDVETSILLIEELIKLGIINSIATPHVIGDLYRNNADSINTSLMLLRNAISEKHLNFKVNAAAEYMLDAYFLELLQKKVPLLTLKNNLVLTEFSYAERPYNAESIVFTIITEGYQPVLAHPERYAYYHNDYKQFHHLADLGFLLQINLLSLTGYYGKAVAKAADYILKNNLASFTGTDLHHVKHIQALQLPANKIIFAQAFKEQKLNEEMFF